MENKSQDKKINLLIVTQKVDVNDPILGFFHRWIEEFAKHCNKLTVICLQKGDYSLPENVRVLSLGKEEYLKQKVLRRFVSIYRFYKYIWRERKNYDKVFVHMNQIYILLGYPMWSLLNKKISLWYAHGSVSKMLIIAEKMADVVFSSTKSGFKVDSEKLQIVGQGIDTNLFCPKDIKEDNKILKILTVGRLSIVKDYETIIKAVALARDQNMKIKLDIWGDVTEIEKTSYFDKLKKLIEDFKLVNLVEFKGGVVNRDLPEIINKYDLFINASNTKSLDKAILEAMSCGVNVISCNESFSDIIVDYKKSNLVFESKKPDSLYEKISILYNNQEYRSVENNLRDIVEKDHNIHSFIKKIISKLN